MSKITREQFLRGIGAIQDYRAFVKEVYDIYQRHDVGRIDDVGGGPVLNELTRQLEERCNDPNYEGRGGGCSMIGYMLYDLGGPVTLADGREFMVGTPELLWAYWEQTGEGPFAAEEKAT